MQVETDFLNWLTSNGAWVSPKIAFKDYSSEGAGRGVVATDDIKVDEVLFKIPRNLVLSQKTTKFKADILRNASKEGWSRIMWSIVLEKLSGAESFWSPYFNIVPAKFNLPISWSEADKACLEGTSVLEMIGEPETDFKQNFLKVSKKMSQAKDLSTEQLRDLYFYSGSLVSSYSFMDEDGTILIVPLADILNHKTGHNNARLFMEKDQLQMICVKDIPAGEQVYNTYGDIGNSELLFKYGYLDDPNPFSSVEIHINDFFDFVDDHSCSCHSSSNLKLSTLEKALDSGSLPTSINLPAEPTVSMDLLNWFHKAYKQTSKLDEMAFCYKPCIIALFEFRLKQYRELTPQNDHQQHAKQLIQEQKSILRAYIEFASKQQ